MNTELDNEMLELLCLYFEATPEKRAEALNFARTLLEPLSSLVTTD